MELPKTLFIGLNLHGTIPLDEKLKPETRTVKNNYIIHFALASLGSPTISTLETYQKLGKMTKKRIDESAIDWTATRNKTAVQELVHDIKKELIRSHSDTVVEVRKQKLKSRTFRQFLHTYDRAFQVATFSAYDNIYNKEFQKFTKDELKALRVRSEKKYFNKIVLYNVEGEPDVFDLLAAIGHETDRVTLFDLIDLFTNMGVENLVFFDFSCSVFQSKHEITDRQIRTTRRSWIN